MRAIIAVVFLCIGCGAYDQLEIEQDILIAVELHRPGVTCELLTPTSCQCAMPECTEAALLEATRMCNLLRYGPRIVVE